MVLEAIQAIANLHGEDDVESGWPGDVITYTQEDGSPPTFQGRPRGCKPMMNTRKNGLSMAKTLCTWPAVYYVETCPKRTS